MRESADTRLPGIFDDLDVGINLHDPTANEILDANARLEELYGYSADELRTMGIGDYTAPSTRFSQDAAIQLIQRAADGEPQTFDWQIERSNEELRWVRIHLSATQIDGKRCVISEVHDVTEYRARERRLRLLSRIIRHNLRNKTNVLMGYADRVRQAVEDEALEREIETILDITTEVGGLSDSVKQIEEIAEPSATERSPTDLRAVGRSLVGEARETYPNATFSVTAPRAAWVIADKGIHYAIEHAIRNAVEHNDRETPSVTVSVENGGEEGHGVVRIADNGPPIPETEIEVLRADVETSSTFHGTGVGLWVIQWCVESLGGELTFEENHPRGNVVCISLPKASKPESKPKSDPAIGEK
ncbi:PAS/PAC sensor signal transduction histidine kinase [Halorubrum aidingense JCM 13560]|uniref:histidine kinase n=1 Tax=Halorubrum aidingense JCM 13560 TaxID=1230454 RepID=M0PDQ5_9EURY|nr:PAS domain-containing sensor histidine kinase [Halorubrum aidingense]EMA68176.1 PAS/PAC sensor signal transduction histidine kinase [Halorubrum aidingense JCM 13560]